LAGGKASRFLALLFAGLGMLGVAGIGAYWAMTSDDKLSVEESRRIQIYALVGVLALGAIVIGLLTKSARVWFSTDPSQKAGGIGWTLPLVIVGGLFATAATIQHREHQEATENMFAVDTRIEFRDAESGEPVHNTTQDWSLSGRKDDPLRPRYKISHLDEANASAVEIRGVSGRTVRLTFGSNGYESMAYELTKDSPRKVTLQMKRTK